MTPSVVALAASYLSGSANARTVNDAAGWARVARRHNEAGRHADAAGAATRAVEADHRSARGWRELGVALLGLRDWRRAAEALRVAVARAA